MTRARLFAAALIAAVALASSGGCAARDEGLEGEGLDALRAPTSADVDLLLARGVPASPDAPAPLAAIASWDVRYVQLRDPTDPTKPDPEDPFNGFFLVARDAAGQPVLLHAVALTEDGVAHFVYRLTTNRRGDFVELPLAGQDDPTGRARRGAAVAWLTTEKNRLGAVLGRDIRSGTGVGLRAGDVTAERWSSGVKCAVDLAVFALTLTNPIAMLLAQAAVDGGFALVEAATGDLEGARSEAESAAMFGAIGGAAAGARRAVGLAVERGLVSDGSVRKAKSGGGAALGVAVVAAVGYQAYRSGAKAALKSALDLVVPESCQRTYTALTDVAPPGAPPPELASTSSPSK